VTAVGTGTFVQHEARSVEYKGYRIQIASFPTLTEDGRPAWRPHAVVWIPYNGTRIRHAVETPEGVPSRDEADAIALRRARWWIDAMGNPKAAAEDAVFAQLSREPRTFLDYVIAEYFDPSHPVPALASLTRVERALFFEAVWLNWRRMEEVVEFIRPAPGERILDAGCAVGGIAYRMARAGARVVALDLNAHRLSMGRTILAMLGARVPLLRANCLRLPFRDGSFDKVLSANVFEHIDPDERGAAIEEVWRVLRPGGYAFIYTDNAVHARLRVHIRRLLQLIRLQDPRRWNPGFSGAPRAHGDLVRPAELVRALRRQGFRVRIFYSMPRLRLLGPLASRFYCAVAHKPANKGAALRGPNNEGAGCGSYP
jgi:2-polyprenyl-3-methyl-5-hydroxy-6-metoxy-1,4-benzoquinol methylase